jgi:hypothetical protein
MDIYQRIFISYILYLISYQKKNIPLSLFWAGYVKGYDILILGISKFYILSYILFRKKCQFRVLFSLTVSIFFAKYINKWCKGSKRTRSLIGNIVFGSFPKKIRNKAFYFDTTKKYGFIVFYLVLALESISKVKSWFFCKKTEEKFTTLFISLKVTPSTQEPPKKSEQFLLLGTRF